MASTVSTSRGKQQAAGRGGRGRARGGRGGRGGMAPGMRPVSEADRINLSERLEHFRDSEETEITFEAGLNNHDRAIVHNLCLKMGFKSKSSGKGSQRCVSVYKTTKHKGNEQRSVAPLSLSMETREIITDFFRQFPPDEDEPAGIVELSSVTVEKDSQSRNLFFNKKKKQNSLMGPENLTKEISKLAGRIRSMPALKEIAKQREKLPITSFKDEIIALIENHQVVLVAGETGCGKTTQVPQFILDYMWSKGRACKIVCTQPRRISATSVAERIATERGEPVGETVGYQIRLESQGGPNTSLMFCTNGVLLRKLVNARRSQEYEHQCKSNVMEDEIGLDATHIIVDEIHERDCNADFLLVILRDLLNTSPDLRLVLMSATLDAERFSAYFNGCPTVRVPGFTYPVRVYYLEDALAVTEFRKKIIDDCSLDAAIREPLLLKEDADAMDEALTSAWLNNEFEVLMDMLTENPNAGVLNYQHSLTGVTALMVVAGKGRVDDVSTILSLSANSSLIAKDGSTALDWALKYKEEKIAELIQCYGKERSKSQSSEEMELLEMYHKQSDQEEVDMSLIESLLIKICTAHLDTSERENGAILIFFPGWEDIMQCRERLLASNIFSNGSKYLLLPLHSMVPSAEQKRVFKRPPSGVRKIILATNIAETAITIDDVVCVIDSGRVKEKSYDPYTNVSTLQTSWISKASAKQREGRAGRCQPGVCYHLLSKVRAASLPEFQTPEMKRTPLEELCLKVKLLQPDRKIKDFLSKAVDPPLDLAVSNAVTLLQDIGALTEDEKLTKLGEQLGSLPVHPATSKMLLLAILLNCLDPALTIACAAGYREPFVLPTDPRQKKDAFAARLKLAEAYGGYSDHLATVAAFDGWEAAKVRGQENRFCSQHFMSPGIMLMLDGMRRQLQNELVQKGFIPKGQHPCSRNANDPGIVRAIVAAGLYPMVGMLLPPLPNGQKAVVQTARGEKVRIHQHSANFRLVHYDSKFVSSDHQLLVFDEVTRGDARVYIRNSTLLNPHPLLFLSTELVVAPLGPGSDNDELSDDDEMIDSEEEEVDPVHTNRSSIMAAPDKMIAVVLDRWLKYQALSVEAAQLYCLRERLLAALAYKITKPRSNLPAMLSAAVYTVACMFSYEGVLNRNSSTAVSATPYKFNLRHNQQSLFQEGYSTPRGSSESVPPLNDTLSSGRGQSRSLNAKHYVAVRDGRSTTRGGVRNQFPDTGIASRGSRSSKRPRGR